MRDGSTFLMIEQSCSEAVALISGLFTGAGLQVLRTFDLQVARQANVACPCPHHGTDQCDCQMVVLLVYKHGHEPISIVAHGHDGQTWFSVVDSPQQRADPQLEATVRHTLVSSMPPAAGIQTALHVS